MAEKFKLGDLVWAKMKGFSFWPGKIEDIKVAKKQNLFNIHFYGSNNCAWISHKNIVSHSEDQIQKASSKKMSALFKCAVDEIVKENLLQNKKSKVVSLKNKEKKRISQQKPEYSNVRASEVEMSQIGPTKVEMSKAGTSNIEMSEAGMSKVDVSKVKLPKVGKSKAETSKLGMPKIQSSRARQLREAPSIAGPFKEEPSSVESLPARPSEVVFSRVRPIKVEPPSPESESTLGPSTVELSKVKSSRVVNRTRTSRVRSSTVKQIKIEHSTEEPPTVEPSTVKLSEEKSFKGKGSKGKACKGKTSKGKASKEKACKGKAFKGKDSKGKTSKEKSPKGKTPNIKKEMQKKKEEMKVLKRKMEENEKLIKQEKSFADLFESLTSNLNAKSRVAVIKPYDDVSASTSQSYDRKTFDSHCSESYGNMALKRNCVDTTTLKIGFIGLGSMGQRIVKNLLLTGHNITIWNRSSMKTHQFKDMGAKISNSPKELIEITDVVFSCVSDSEVVETLVFGNCGILNGLEGCQGLSRKKGYVELTTIDVKLSEKVAHAITLSGGRYLEAPISGSRSLAEDGQLSIIAAGNRDIFNDCTSCFNAMTNTTYYLGDEIGAASKLNLIRNSILGVSVAALAESMLLIEEMGLSTNSFLEILRLSPLNCDAMIKNGNAMCQKNFQPDTTLKFIRESLSLTMELSEPVTQPMYVTATADNVFKHAERLQYSEHDVSAIYCATKS